MAGFWRPSASLTFSAEHGRSEGAPSLSDLNRPTYTDSPFVCDTRAEPCSNQQVERVRGGNPGLEPSGSSRFRIGAEWRAGPHGFGIDWFRSESTGLPAQVSPQHLVNLDAAGERLPPGGAVIRDGTGRIDRILSPLLNSGESEGRGVALRAGTAWETGWADMKLDAHVLRQTSSVSRVAGSVQPGDFPRHRAHASLKATRNGVTARLDTRFVSGFRNAAGTGHYGSWIGHDLTLHWQDAFGSDGLAIAGGVLNVGDNGPALNPASPDSPSITADSLRGRTFFLRVSMAF